MKKIVILLIMPLLAYTQIEKGHKMIGGNITFSNNDIQRTLFVQPQFGYFVSPKLALGSGVGLMSTKTKLSNPLISYSSLNLSPFVRYYVLTKKVNPFIQLGGNFTTILTENGIDFPNQSALNVGIGNTLFITKNVGIDFTLNYNHTFQSRLRRGINSGIGFQIFL
jgi:outer membrane protein W